jgi:hypothetical protein
MMTYFEIGLAYIAFGLAVIGGLVWIGHCLMFYFSAKYRSEQDIVGAFFAFIPIFLIVALYIGWCAYYEMA